LAEGEFNDDEFYDQCDRIGLDSDECDVFKMFLKGENEIGSVDDLNEDEYDVGVRIGERVEEGTVQRVQIQ
jgi:hypothetical protein